MSGSEFPLWMESWETLLALPKGAPESVVALIAILCIYAAVVFPSSVVVSFLARKFGADLQARIGPNRAGPAGVLQPFSDLLKLLQKEATRRLGWGEKLWLAVYTMALYSTVAVLPLGSAVLLIDAEMSAFLPFWAALVLALGTMLLGLNQGSVPGWFGGVRVASQALAGAVPSLVCLLVAGIRSGGFRWSYLAGSQAAQPFSWGWVSSPFDFVAFGVFLISGLVLMGVAPLDGGLSVQDIHGGVSSQLDGAKLWLFRMGRFYGFFLWSIITVVLFLGAWKLPQGLADYLSENQMVRIQELAEVGTLMIKTLILMTIVSIVSFVTPRLRADQVTDFSWRVLSPLAFVSLAGAAIWNGWIALQ